MGGYWGWVPWTVRAAGGEVDAPVVEAPGPDAELGGSDISWLAAVEAVAHGVGLEGGFAPGPWDSLKMCLGRGRARGWAGVWGVFCTQYAGAVFISDFGSPAELPSPRLCFIPAARQVLSKECSAAQGCWCWRVWPLNRTGRDGSGDSQLGGRQPQQEPRVVNRPLGRFFVEPAPATRGGRHDREITGSQVSEVRGQDRLPARDFEVGQLQVLGGGLGLGPAFGPLTSCSGPVHRIEVGPGWVSRRQTSGNQARSTDGLPRTAGGTVGGSAMRPAEHPHSGPMTNRGATAAQRKGGRGWSTEGRVSRRSPESRPPGVPAVIRRLVPSGCRVGRLGA